MKRPRIVIIEDDTWVSEHYERVLGADYELSHATNALEGIELIDNVKPRAIILDIFMPGPNGIVLLHEIRSHADLSQIPIVVATNNAAELNEADMKHYGVQVILDKTTMHPDDILAAVKKVVS